jgi:hypothetical protein
MLGARDKKRALDYADAHGYKIGLMSGPSATVHFYEKQSYRFVVKMTKQDLKEWEKAEKQNRA